MVVTLRTWSLPTRVVPGINTRLADTECFAHYRPSTTHVSATNPTSFQWPTSAKVGSETDLKRQDSWKQKKISATFSAIAELPKVMKSRLFHASCSLIAIPNSIGVRGTSRGRIVQHSRVVFGREVPSQQTCLFWMNEARDSLAFAQSSLRARMPCKSWSLHHQCGHHHRTQTQDQLRTDGPTKLRRTGHALIAGAGGAALACCTPLRLLAP